MRHAEFQGIKFHAAGQLWSNPALRTQDAGIPALMVRPSFLDLVNLAARKDIEDLRRVNSALLEEGLITQTAFAKNEEMLRNIAVAKHALG